MSQPQPPRRSRSSGRGTSSRRHGDEEPMVRSQLDALFEEWTAKVEQSQQQQFQHLKEQLVAGVTQRVEASTRAAGEQYMADTKTLLRRYDERVQAQFEEQGDRIALLDTSQQRMAEDFAAMQARVEACERALALAEQEVAAPPTGDNWDRETDPTILVVGCAAHVAKDAVAPVLHEWLSEADIKRDHYHIEGALLAKRFVVRMHGDKKLASRRASKAHMSLRTGGEWRRMSVASPAGDDIALYVGIDKNGKQQATERQGKILRQAVQEVVGGDPHLLRRDGVVTINWQPLARVEPRQHQPARVLFQGPLVQQMGVDREAIRAAFERLAGAPTAAQAAWSL